MIYPTNVWKMEFVEVCHPMKIKVLVDFVWMVNRKKQSVLNIITVVAEFLIFTILLNVMNAKQIIFYF